MAFLEKLIASDENVARVAAVYRGEEVMPPLDDHEWKLLEVVLYPNKLNALGHVTLGVGVPTEKSELFGQEVLVGEAIEDVDNPDGIWLTYVPV